MAATLEEKIARLHDWYCRRTGLEVKVKFFTADWTYLLRDYEWDEHAVHRDADIIIRYLLKMIKERKRNNGALKLRNFLQIDTFNQDLAEAKLALGQARPRPAQWENKEQTIEGATRTIEVPKVAEPEPISESAKAASLEILRQCKERLTR